MRIDTIRFQNFRCFDDRRFDFAARFNLLIGDNGSGKTSILHGAVHCAGIAIPWLSRTGRAFLSRR